MKTMHSVWLTLGLVALAVAACGFSPLPDLAGGGGAGSDSGTSSELDCDAQREQCSRTIDEDCNPATTLSAVPCVTLTCPYPRCVCDDAGESESCLEPVYGQMFCSLPAPGGKPCEGAGPVPLPLICPAGCQVQLGWAPEGLEVGLSDNPGEVGMPLGVFVPVPDGRAFLTMRALDTATRSFPPVLDIILRVRTGIELTEHVVPVALFEGACEAPSLLDCPG